MQKKWWIYGALILVLIIGGLVFSISEYGKSRLPEEQTGFGFTEPASQEETTGTKPEETQSLFLTVHVCGAVASPGVYQLEDGSRICEAVEAAGGFAEGAARDYLNLALKVADGEKLVVPFLDQVEDPFGEEGDVRSGQEEEENQSGLVNINTADKEKLMTLPGIGEAKAGAVISYREANGEFGAIEDIMNVPGIKEAAFSQIKDLICV